MLSTHFPVFAKFLSSSLPIHGSHRGGRHWGKENTFETYRRAVEEAQTNILEIDIWKTNDEQLVLNHDGIINGIQVTQTTLKHLQQIDPQLITLDQLLSSFIEYFDFFNRKILFISDEFTSKSSLVFFFDMKDANAIPLTLDAIQRYHLEDRVIFGAVDRAINKQLQKQKLPSIPICADTETMMKFVQIYRQGQVDDNYPYEHDILGFFLESYTRSLITKHLVNTIHKAGKPLALVGTLLDDPKVQKEMIELGIDILFTDRPDILRQTLDSYSKN
jgi:glycerophosphoryl diester phosphodiesterase